jgi:hypothetical protein
MSPGRRCSNCFQTKPLSAFYRKLDRYQSRCKACNTEVCKGYRATLREHGIEETSRERCQRCDEELHPDREVWLELDVRHNTYTEGNVPEEHSQGLFAFGPDCAAAVLKNGGRLGRRRRSG